jgi:hypothetical protein
MIVAKSCFGFLDVYIQVAFVSQSGVRGGAVMTTLGRLEMPLPRCAMCNFLQNQNACNRLCTSTIPGRFDTPGKIPKAVNVFTDPSCAEPAA